MKILIVRIGAMGDVLHALPAVAALRRARPEWLIEWVVDTRWAPLVSGEDGRGPHVDCVHLADTKLWSRAPHSAETRRSIAALRRELKQARFDVVVDLQGTIRSAVIGRFAAAKRFAGYADPRESAAAWLYSQKISRHGGHVVQQAVALLGEACGADLAPGLSELPLDAAAERWAEQAVLRRPLCVLAPGAGWAAKQWPAQQFGALAGELSRRGFDIVVNASSGDNAHALEVAATSGGTARVLPCSVAELVALLRRTDLFVGGDSGPTHLAAALAVPLVALFGPTDPARNGPWGPGPSRVLRHASSVTSYKHVATADTGLAQLTVEEVLEAALSLNPGLRQ